MTHTPTQHDDFVQRRRAQLDEEQLQLIPDPGPLIAPTSATEPPVTNRELRRVAAELREAMRVSTRRIVTELRTTNDLLRQLIEQGHHQPTNTPTGTTPPSRDAAEQQP